MPTAPALGDLLRRIRTRPRPGAPVGLTTAQAARRTSLWGQRSITASFWTQVERGRSGASESKLLRMALALDAGPEEIEALFRAAGYGNLFDALVGLGASSRTPVMPRGAEAGILSDPRLAYEKRQSLLAHLQDILDTLPAELREVSTPEDDDDGDSD